MTDQENKPVEEASSADITNQPDTSETVSHVKNDSPVVSHEQHVVDLSLVLFDRTRILHDLSDECRLVMELAAYHHNLSAPTKKKKPERAMRKKLKNTLDKSQQTDKLMVLSVVLANFQGKLKRKSFDRLDLSPIEQREALTIAALLRIAVGLDTSDTQKTTIQQIEPTREQVLVIVDGPEAVSDAAMAQHNARLWAKIGYPEFNVLESAKAAKKLLLYPEPMERIGIAKDDLLAEAGRKVMRFHFARMLANEDGTRIGEDIEALHDMRVATRRLRSAFEVFGQAFEPGTLKPYLKGLRATGRALGGVRNLDVAIEKAQEYLRTLPEEKQHNLDNLIHFWQEQRKKKRTKMLAFLDSEEYHTFKRKYNIFLSTPGAGSREIPKDEPAPQLVRELAPVLIYIHLAKVRAFDRYILEAPIDFLHGLRIEFKKLRYTVEYFQEALGDQAVEVIEDLKTLQDHLGDLNDADFAAKSLAKLVEEMSDDENDEEAQKDTKYLKAVKKYMDYQISQRDRLLDEFPQAWAHFNRDEFRIHLSAAVSSL